MRDYNIYPRHIICHLCNFEFQIGTVHPGEQVNCPQCRITVIRIEHNPIVTPLIYATLALFAFFVCLSFPLIEVVTPFIEDVTNISILDMFEYLSQSGFLFLAFIFILFVVINPLMFLIATLYIYSSLLLQKKFPGIKQVAYMMGQLRTWMMADIFFISILVSLIKIKALATIHFGYTMVILFGYVIFIARIVLSISDYWVKEQILNIEGNIINRGKKTIHEIKKQARVNIHLAWALLLTAVLLYLPVNMLPILITNSMGAHFESTLLRGVIQIWSSGDYLIALIIFIASFLIPIIKISVLFVLLLAISGKKIISSSRLTKYYVVVEKIGRWSMIDAFVVILMVSLFTHHSIFILPGSAIIYFCLLVNITMLATRIIDTRLLWPDHTNNSANMMEKYAS